MKNSLGQKIKFFRKRAGMSQMDLEMGINGAAGMVSRIESGKVNPNKETLINIAYVLKLNTSEIASLFDIDLSKVNDLEPTLLDMAATLDLTEVLDKVVNDLILKMGYIASAILLVGGDKIGVGGLTASDISAKVVQFLTVPLDELNMSISENPGNLTVQAIKENKPILTYRNAEYLSPMVPKEAADGLQAATGDKSTLVYPLKPNGKVIGAIVFAKKMVDDFSEDMSTLDRVVPRIAIAINNALEHKVVSSGER